MATIESPNSLTTALSALGIGVTKLKFTVTDNFGRVTSDTVNISRGAPIGLTLNAGADQYLDEGTTTTNFYAEVTNIQPGITVASVTWSVLGGVTGVVFSTGNALVTGVSGVPVAARTTFRVTVVDNNGTTYTDDIDVSVARPSEMYYTKNGVDNQYDPDNLALLAWSYLCQGYDELKPGGYGLLLFFHGMGVNGDVTVPQNDINALLLPTEGLPKFLYDKTFPMGMLVIAPQNRTGIWSAASANKALQWALSKFNIDLTQVFYSGLSSGGTASVDLPILDNSVPAAMIPSNATTNELPNGANNELVKNKGWLFVSAYNDTQVPPFANNNVTAMDIDALNNASPKGYFPPLALLPWEGVHGPETWNDYLYNKTMAPFDFEVLLRMFSTDLTRTMTNFVVQAETSHTWYDYTVALQCVTKMPAGTPRNNLLARLQNVLTAITGAARYWCLNFATTPTTWTGYKVNNITNVTAGTVVSNMPDVKDSGSTLTFTSNIVGAGSVLDNTGLNNDYMGLYRDMFTSGYKIMAPTQWTLSNLDPTKRYDIILYCHNKSQVMYQNNDVGRTGTWSMANGDQVQSIHEGYNTMFTTEHWNVAPDGSGNIVMNVAPLYNGTYGRIAAIVLREKTNTVVRANFGKYNMALSSAAAEPDWATLLGDPTTAVRSVADPVSGWVINTVNTGANYWQLGFGSYANDNEQPNPGTFPAEFPDKVARSARFNYVANFDRALQNYNMEIIGIPGMGLPAGQYRVKIFSTSSADFSPQEVRCKIGKYSGQYTFLVNQKDNFTKYYTFRGNVKEGETIKIGIFRPLSQWGLAFVNGIIVEKLS